LQKNLRARAAQAEHQRRLQHDGVLTYALFAAGLALRGIAARRMG